MADRRLALLTLDFEGFTAQSAPAWIAAMERWACAAAAAQLPFVFFLSLEHLAVLRRSHHGRYVELTRALRLLADSGCEPHVHNHCLFDWKLGVRSVDTAPFANPVAGYPYRASMWYDVVRRNRRPWSEWVLQLRTVYDELLDDMGTPRPEHVAFRAGGWDTGTTSADWAGFLEGLERAGFAVDSSDLGRLSGRPPGRFARSTYRLTGGLAELAPCVWMDCGAAGRPRGLPSPPSATVRQWPLLVPGSAGVAVVVLHFDHLFHDRHARWALIDDPDRVGSRIERFMDSCERLLRLLRLTPCVIGEAMALVG